MTALSVNVNKVAWLRNARGGARPDVAASARTALDAGANGITVHPRPDERHIRAADVDALRDLVARHPGTEFNIEGNPQARPRGGYPGLEALIDAVRPHQCTLVPDADEQLTSDHGWDLTDGATRANVAETVARYQAKSVRVSLFVDPRPEQILAAKGVGADRVELYTGPFAAVVAKHGLAGAEADACWTRYRRAAARANEAGLGVNAGHDLDLANLARFLEIDGIAEVSIGHALIADALEMGLAEAVRRYSRICRDAPSGRSMCADFRR